MPIRWFIYFIIPFSRFIHIYLKLSFLSFTHKYIFIVWPIKITWITLIIWHMCSRTLFTHFNLSYLFRVRLIILLSVLWLITWFNSSGNTFTFIWYSKFPRWYLIGQCITIFVNILKSSFINIKSHVFDWYSFGLFFEINWDGIVFECFFRYRWPLNIVLIRCGVRIPVMITMWWDMICF